MAFRKGMNPYQMCIWMNPVSEVHIYQQYALSRVSGGRVCKTRGRKKKQENNTFDFEKFYLFKVAQCL